MSLFQSFCRKHKCNKEESYYTKLLIKKQEKDNFTKILLTRKNNLSDLIEEKLQGKTKTETNQFVYQFKIFILDNFSEYIDIIKIEDEVLVRIEKFNKLEKGFLTEDKLFFVQNIEKQSSYKLYKKLLKEVLENQKFKTKLDFNDKQKILAKCAEMAYCYPADNKKIRPKNFKDPVFKTRYIVDSEISNLDRTIWINDEKSVFGKKIIIISYKGTGLATKTGGFSFLGNYKSDINNDLKIMKGKFTNSREMKKYIKDFETLVKTFGKEYKYFMTGHSLGGRIAFEIHRKKPNLIKECHIFNAGFGIDLTYYKDILKTKKRNYKWEKNLYSYHIGGKKKDIVTDDDFISLLSGGYGKSYTFYENFNSYLKGHSITEFL